MKNTARGVAVVLGILAVAFLAIGLVVNNQASFAKDYVQSQLAARQITFTPVSGLMPNQKRVACLVQNAGKPLVTGEQAACYANYQIGLDMLMIDNGRNYVQDHYAAYLLRLKAQQALASDPASPVTQALVKESAELSQKAEDIFDGETMKGLLLTAYGFSVLGDKGAMAATASFALAGLFAIGSLLGLAITLRGRSRVEAVVPQEALAAA